MTKNLRLTELENIPESTGLVITTPKGQQIALFREGDQVYALDNLCPHAGGPLGEGPVENGEVKCPWHDWSFSIKNGTCSNMPGEDVASFPLTVENGIVYLEETN